MTSTTNSWRHLSAAPAPFAEDAWRHAQEILARRGGDPATEAEIARTVTALLDRAAAGPQADPGLPLPAGNAAARAAARRKDRKIAARARASAPDRRAAPAGKADTDGRPPEVPGEEPPAATVVPLEIFDARKEAQRRW